MNPRNSTHSPTSEEVAFEQARDVNVEAHSKRVPYPNSVKGSLLTRLRGMIDTKFLSRAPGICRRKYLNRLTAPFWTPRESI